VGRRIGRLTRQAALARQPQVTYPAGTNNLGHVLHDLGDLTAARTHHQRALTIYEAQLGPDHPNVARSLDHLGAVLADLGDLPAACTHHQRALAIRQACFGTDHPDTERSQHDSAAIEAALREQ
jgi:tetratricopeptide (TPR) repeat protein